MALFALPLGAALLLRAPAAATAAAERRVAAMGTTFQVVVRLPRREQALVQAGVAIDEVRRVEDLLTTWRAGSPLSRVNEASPGEEVPTGVELASVLSEVFDWSGRTGHAFDPTVAPLVRAWDLRGQGRLASPEEIAAARAAVGVDRFSIEPGRGVVVRRDPHAGIEEGAWGKGYALDRAGARLREAGVADALLDLGGQVLALGKDAGGTSWEVLIAHPRRRQQPVARIALPGGMSLATSGNSERRLVVGGRMIGHLLDPRTGLPASDFGSVCVVSPSGLVADVLSTAFFVLGPTDGLALSAALRAEGIANEVLFLVDRGAGLEARASKGFQSLIRSTDANAVGGLSETVP